MIMTAARILLGRLFLALLLLGALSVVLVPVSHAEDDPSAQAATEPVAPEPWWKSQAFWAHMLHRGALAPAYPAHARGAPNPASTWDEVRRRLAVSGGTSNSSDPTTVPIVDDDLAFMVSPPEGLPGTEFAQLFTRGAGQVIVVLDGGFNPHHPALAGRISPWGWDTIDQDDDPLDLGNGIDDDHDGLVDEGVGHGTFVVGKILEIAPDATVILVRIRDDEGWGTDLELVRGLEYALQLAPDVVNLSCQSAPGRTPHVARLLRQLRESGTLVVVSAGNEGMDDVSELGRANDALIVGSVDASEHVASFSNYTWDASKRVIFAPGVDLHGPYGAPFDHSNATWSGTSFSTALVSGAAALVRSLEPWLRPEEVMDRLQWTAAPVLTHEGYHLPFGRLDLIRAVLP